MSYLLDLAASLNAEIETTLDHIRRDALIERLGEVQQALASGGGSGGSGSGGGGGASAANQVAGNNFLSTIDSSAAQSLNTLSDVLAELRDDTFVSESVWFDRKDTSAFYIRRLTFDQDTQTPVLNWYDKDGNQASPDISLMIQCNTTNDLQQENINQIANVGFIVQQIQANQQNQLASQITQAQVVAAIQAAADIDTMIARLTSIDAKVMSPNIRALTTATDSVAVGSLPGTVAADIAAIKTNTAKISQFSFQLAEDSAGTVFLIKTDTVLGTSTNINVVTGLPFTPVGAIELTDPTAAQVTIEQNEYDCITANASNWVVGDIVERIRTINTAAGAVINTFWYKADGSILATIPIIGTDAIDSDRQSLTVIRSIDAKTPTVGQKTSALSSPVVLASDQSDINPNRSIATAAFTKTTDGINVATVKAASVAPVATDTALVVTLSPNSPPGNPNTTFGTSAYSRITDGVAQAAVKVVTTGAITDTALIVTDPLTAARTGGVLNALQDGSAINRIKGSSTNYAEVKAPSVLPATSVDMALVATLRDPVSFATGAAINQTTATAGFEKILSSDGTNVAKVIPGGISVVGASETALVVALSPNSAIIRTNQTASTGGFSFITDGVSTAAVKPASVLPLSTDPALVVTLREAIVTSGLTDTQLRATPVPVSGSVNQTLATTGFSKIVDSAGVNTATVRAANSPTLLTDTSLVVSISGNSSNYAPLTAGTVATRHAIAGGVALPLNALPGLTGSQQYPLRLTPNGALMVQIDPNTTTSTRFGQSNPLADTSLSTASKIRSFTFTNESAVILYLQVHQSNAALVSGTSIPFNGWVYRIPGNITLILGVSDFGTQGTALPFLGTPRLAISTTRALFTAPTAAQLLGCTLSYEVI